MRLKTASIQKSYTTLVGLHHIPNPSPQRASPSINFMDLANAVTLVSRIQSLFLTHIHTHIYLPVTHVLVAWLLLSSCSP